MRAIKTSTGIDITLDGDLLALVETLFQEVTVRHELARTFEDMMREIQHIADQLSHDELRAYADIFKLPPSKLLALRTDSHLGQLAAIRAGYGIGICQTPLARREPKLTRVLAAEFEMDLPAWVVMHEDLMRVPRIRATFHHLVASLTAYCAGSA